MSIQDKINAAVAEFEAESREIARQIQSEADSMADSGEVLQDNGTLFSVKDEGTTVNFEWREVVFDIPYPEFTMREQNIALDVPQVTMELKTIKFKIPYPKMVDTKVGEKPEVTCGWKMTKGPLGIKTKTWQCTTTMTPIITAVPQLHWREEEVITKIPEIRMERQDIVLDMPSVTVTMKQVRFNMLVPTSVSYEDQEEDIAEGEQLIQRKQTELDTLSVEFDRKVRQLSKDLVNEEFNKAVDTIRTSYTPIETNYVQAIEGSKAAIKLLKPKGPSDELAAEEAKLADTIAKMQTAMQPMVDQIAAIEAERQKALADLEI